MTNSNKTAKKGMKVTLYWVIFLCVIFGFVLIMFNEVMTRVKYEQSQAITEMRQEQFESIYLYLSELYVQGYDSSGETSIMIKDNILDEYSDLSILKSSLDNSIYPNPLLDIFESGVKGEYLNGVENNNNAMFIADSTGIITELDMANPIGKSTYQSWNDLIETSANKKLAINAVECLLQHENDSIIGWEDYSGENHQSIGVLDYDSLENVYLKEGLNGLKHYTFLIPTYINDSGDIFGQSDFEHSIRVGTHKFIIVQKFNIVDQLKSNYNHMVISNSDEESAILYRNTVTLNWLYCFGLFLAISIVSAGFVTASFCNKVILCQANCGKFDNIGGHK